MKHKMIKDLAKNEKFMSKLRSRDYGDYYWNGDRYIYDMESLYKSTKSTFEKMSARIKELEEENARLRKGAFIIKTKILK